MADIFVDRRDAGQQLAAALRAEDIEDGVVLGLARGGVAVGHALAAALDLPLIALSVRKLGAPHNPELAIGAVSETGRCWIDRDLVRATGATEEYVQREVERQTAEARRRRQEYAVGPGLDTVRGRTAIVTDDGIATGATALVAVQTARELGARRVVLATPMASSQAIRTLEPHVDRLVVLTVPDPFLAVGMHYQYFGQVSDGEVIGYLRDAEEHRSGETRGPSGEPADVVISAGSIRLPGILVVPERAGGVVLFAHGSGSGRLSPRNAAVARTLQEGGLATLLVDLLTEGEAMDRRLVFDIPLLAARLRACTAFLAREPSTASLPLGYFGASTGAAAALVAAAEEGDRVRAVVSRGGRPDLAGDALATVRAPTLLIVGSADTAVLELNREAIARLHSVVRLEIIPGATHLFEEPGALQQVAALAADWFLRYLP